MNWHQLTIHVSKVKFLRTLFWRNHFAASLTSQRYRRRNAWKKNRFQHCFNTKNNIYSVKLGLQTKIDVQPRTKQLKMSLVCTPNRYCRVFESFHVCTSISNLIISKSIHEKAFSSKINANRNSGIFNSIWQRAPRSPRREAVDYCAASARKLPRLHGRFFPKILASLNIK